ncbi:MALE GAMETOPHYTE DEFECTIVE [Heracleum sosnowskyi]|uniref:MALE GAMETOPHYTE DEFECTIVE n=1 Tax=Heracleum sosnowskyi TaxID=360622 RepID=A0AAD8HH70_9APIA|nr:MALE GAMETOPHYTE DEFECTIVE [Heracleum sosnowskyi]
MALASRILSRATRQVYTGPAILQSEYAAPVRLFATAPPATKGDSPPPTLKGDELLKNIFLDVKNKFETAIGVLRKEKITIDPEDPAAVSQYAKVMKTVREKAKLFSESERTKYTIVTRTAHIEDARTHMLALKEIRIKRGLTDELGAEAMMMDAVENIEKQIKKPLMKADKEGMAMLHAEFEKINKKLGISKEELPKYEEELELKIAKAQLEELEKDALEAMETQKKREEFKDEEMPEVKSLDIRNFL